MHLARRSIFDITTTSPQPIEKEEWYYTPGFVDVTWRGEGWIVGIGEVVCMIRRRDPTVGIPKRKASIKEC